MPSDRDVARTRGYFNPVFLSILVERCSKKRPREEGAGMRGFGRGLTTLAPETAELFPLVRPNFFELPHAVLLTRRSVAQSEPMARDSNDSAARSSFAAE